MNNEIKEILDRLERIDHKEYSCGFEFADSGSFDEDCRCFEERKKMANYITNLQQENKKQKEEKRKVRDYINKHCVNEKISKEVGYKCYTMADTNELEKIMKILGDKEN